MKELIISTGLNEPSMDLLGDIFDYVIDFTDHFNTLLEELNPHDLHIQTNLAILRASFMKRNELENWYTFRDKTLEVITKREIPINRMYGLLDNKS